MQADLNTPESLQLDDQIAELNTELNSVVKTNTNLQQSLKEMQTIVNNYFNSINKANSVGIFLKRKVIQKNPSDVNEVVIRKDKEGINLQKFSNILKKDNDKYETIIQQYTNPNDIEEKETTLRCINTKIQQLENELLTLKRFEKDHSQCNDNEGKLMNKLFILREEHSNYVELNIIKQSFSTEKSVSKSSPIDISYKINIKKQNKEKPFYDVYSQLFSNEEDNKYNGQTGRHIKVNYSKLSLFRSEEVIKLKKVLPVKYLDQLTTRYKVIDDITDKIKKQSAQEKNYYKHSNIQINQAYKDNKSQLDLEIKQNVILINDLHRYVNNIKHFKKRIKEIKGVIRSIQTKINSKEESNKHLMKTIELLSFNNEPEPIIKKKGCSKCTLK